MIQEFDLVTLKHAIPDKHLSAGLEGTVVDAMHIADGFVTVEFFDRDETVAVVPVKLDYLQTIEQGEPEEANARGTTLSTAPFVYNDGVIYVRSWEWNTSQSSLLGHHVRTTVYPVMEIRRQGFARIPTPIFALTFDNGWTVAVAMKDTRSLEGNGFEATRADAFISPYGAWNDLPDTVKISDRSDEDVLQIVRDVAERETQRLERATYRLTK